MKIKNRIFLGLICFGLTSCLVSKQYTIDEIKRQEIPTDPTEFNIIEVRIDTLNKLNSNGKKTGYWLLYLDNRAFPTDSLNAYFLTYEFYDNGKKINNFKNNWKLNGRCVYDGIHSKKGHPIPVNGTFKWIDSDKRDDSVLVASITYKNGFLVFMKMHYYSDVRDTTVWSTQELLYLDRHYNNIPGTYYLEVYTNNRVYNSDPLKKYWYRKGKKRWKEFRI